MSNVRIAAPLERVFHAYTNKDMVVKWWSQGEPFDVDYYDAKTGGNYRFVTKSPEGREDSFRGCFHLVKENECVIQTFEYEGLPEYGHVALERSDFRAVSESETEIQVVTTFQSANDRDAMIEGGMEDGFRSSINALGRIVESI